MTFNLIALHDQHITRSRPSLPRPLHFFPSEASIQYTDEHGLKRTEGTCLRAIYYRLTGEAGAPTKRDPYSEWILKMGKAAEKELVEDYKEMGIWVDNNVKFYDDRYNISGEIDVFVRDPETHELVVTELKTFYGYNATKDICGNTQVQGKPKTNQLLQLLIYIDNGQRLNLFSCGKLVYYARDSGNRREFNVALKQEGDAKRPFIDGEPDYRFTMADVYRRYQDLASALKARQCPPQDYELVWSPEKTEMMYDCGEVSESAMKNYKKSPKKNPVGDWNCRYCGWCKFCWSKTADV